MSKTHREGKSHDKRDKKNDRSASPKKGRKERKHHGDLGVPSYSPRSEQVPAPNSSLVISGGITELLALEPGFDGEKFFSVAEDGNGAIAVFCARIRFFRKKNEDGSGEAEKVPYIAVYLGGASKGNSLRSLPAEACLVSIPLGQVKRGVAKKTPEMSTRDFGYRKAIGEYLYRAKERMESLDRAERRKKEFEALAQFAKGSSGKFAVWHGGHIVVIVADWQDGKFTARPVFLDKGHPAESEIRKLMEKKVFLRLHLIGKEELESFPPNLEGFRDGLQAFHRHIREALVENELLDDLKKAVKPVTVVVSLRKPKGNGQKPHAQPLESNMAPSDSTVLH